LIVTRIADEGRCSREPEMLGAGGCHGDVPRDRRGSIGVVTLIFPVVAPRHGGRDLVGGVDREARGGAAEVDRGRSVK
jgi:hypothetical protein